MLGKLMLLSSGNQKSSSWFLSDNSSLSTVIGFSGFEVDSLGNIYSLVSNPTSSYVEKIAPDGSIVFTKKITEHVGKIALTKNYLYTVSDIGYAIRISQYTHSGTDIGSIIVSTVEYSPELGPIVPKYDTDELFFKISSWTDLIEGTAQKSAVISSSGAKTGQYVQYYNFTTSDRAGCVIGTEFLAVGGDNSHTIEVNSSVGNYVGYYVIAAGGMDSVIDDIITDGTYLYVSHGRSGTASYLTKINHATKTVVWNKKFTHPAAAYGKKIAIDSKGNIYAILPRYSSTYMYLIKVTQPTYQTASVEWVITINCSVTWQTYYNWFVNIKIDQSTDDIIIKQRNNTSSGNFYLRLVADNIPIGSYTVYTPGSGSLVLANSSITIADDAVSVNFIAQTITGSSETSQFSSGIATSMVSSILNTRTVL